MSASPIRQAKRQENAPLSQRDANAPASQKPCNGTGATPGIDAGIPPGTAAAANGTASDGVTRSGAIDDEGLDFLNGTGGGIRGAEAGVAPEEPTAALSGGASDGPPIVNVEETTAETEDRLINATAPVEKSRALIECTLSQMETEVNMDPQGFRLVTAGKASSEKGLTFDVHCCTFLLANGKRISRCDRPNHKCVYGGRPKGSCPDYHSSGFCPQSYRHHSSKIYAKKNRSKDCTIADKCSYPLHLVCETGPTGITTADTNCIQCMDESRLHRPLSWCQSNLNKYRKSRAAWIETEKKTQKNHEKVVIESNKKVLATKQVNNQIRGAESLLTNAVDNCDKLYNANFEGMVEDNASLASLMGNIEVYGNVLSKYGKVGLGMVDTVPTGCTTFDTSTTHRAAQKRERDGDGIGGLTFGAKPKGPRQRQGPQESQGPQENQEPQEGQTDP